MVAILFQNFEKGKSIFPVFKKLARFKKIGPIWANKLFI
jgi:hypothetical protein